jgi:four helix bundle protein
LPGELAGSSYCIIQACGLFAAAFFLQMATVVSTVKEMSGQQMSESFKDLVVWQRAVQMSLEIYKLTSAFPSSERFGLTNQLRRASVSVASNIAEGYGKSSRGEYMSFLGHARGSNGEVQTQLIISQGLNFGTLDSLRHAESLSNEVGRMLVVMMNKLKR